MYTKTLSSIFFWLFTIFLLPVEGQSQQVIPKLNFDQLEEYLHLNNDTTYVINFWATWCGPCVKELPYFEELNKINPDKKIRVILVSLDFPQHYEKSLLPFVKKKGIESRVLFLDDARANYWIPKVDKDWSGAIPATLIYQGENRWFHEGSMTKKEIFDAAERVMSNE